MRTALGALALAIAAIGTVTTDADAAPRIPSPPDHVFVHGLPAAPDEGECYTYRCVWDARHQGNHRGQSMILTRWHGGYVAQPISHRRAHRLQAAWCARPSVTCGGYDD